MPNSNESEPNMENAYKQAYDRLLALAPESLRLKALDPFTYDKEVRAFCKRVIALAEQDDK